MLSLAEVPKATLRIDCLLGGVLASVESVLGAGVSYLIVRSKLNLGFTMFTFFFSFRVARA